MTNPPQDARPERAGGEATHENDSGQRPDHEAVGVGVIHGPGTLDAGDDSGLAGADAGSASQPSAGSSGEALDADREQRLPTMAQDDAAGLEKVTGVVAQTRQDSGTEPFERIVDVLRERLQQAGVELSDGDIEELARQVSTGDASDASDAGESGEG